MNSLGWDIMMQAGAGWRGGGLLRAAHLLRNDHTSTSLPQNLHILSLMSDIKWSLFLSVHLTFTNPIIYHLFCSISSSTLSTLVYPHTPPRQAFSVIPPSPERIWAKCLMGCNKWLRVCYHLVLHISTDAWLTFLDLLLFPTAFQQL